MQTGWKWPRCKRSISSGDDYLAQLGFDIADTFTDDIGRTRNVPVMLQDADAVQLARDVLTRFKRVWWFARAD